MKHSVGEQSDSLNSWLTLEQAREFLNEGNGQEIKVAILDSGVEFDNPALKGVIPSDDLAVTVEGFDLKIVEGEGRDVFGHGTAVCDIIRKIAPRAEIGSFRVLGNDLGSRTQIIREGARLAIERGYKILNCSFGCGRRDHVLQYKDWVDEAYLRGRHIVCGMQQSGLGKA